MIRYILSILLIASACVAGAQSKEIQKLYSKRKFEQVISKAEFDLKKNPNDVGLQLILARAYADFYETEKAMPILEKLYQQTDLNAEQKAWVTAYLGKCYFVYDQKEKAIETLKKCAMMEGNRKAVKSARATLSKLQMGNYFKDWTIEEGKHIRFHYQKIENIKDKGAYQQKRELACERMLQLFDYQLSKKIDVFVWDDKYVAYQKMNRPLGFSNAALGIVNVYNGQEFDYEICHMLSKRIAKTTYTSMLIKEGLGVYFDKMDQNLFKMARKEIPAEGFQVVKLWEDPKNYKRNLSYPVGGALIEFLINTSGKDKLIKLLRKQSIEHAEEVYPDFEKKMKTFNAMLLRR